MREVDPEAEKPDIDTPSLLYAGLTAPYFHNGSAATLEQLIESLEARSLSPRILELRGRLANALGDEPASDRALHQALDLYRTLGATGHAERLARELSA